MVIDKRSEWSLLRYFQSIVLQRTERWQFWKREMAILLKQDHCYIYQVCAYNYMQTVYMIYYPSVHAGAMQLFCAQRNYYDFVVWTEEDIHFELFYLDECFRMEIVSTVKQFFITAILSRLVGKCYSRRSESGSTPKSPVESPWQSAVDPTSALSPLTSSTSDTAKFYYCHGPEEWSVTMNSSNVCCWN